MGVYTELTGADIPTREAAVLAGIPRATATRRPHALAGAASAPVPANKLDPGERSRILATVNSARFVDLAPIQIFAQLLD